MSDEARPAEVQASEPEPQTDEAAEQQFADASTSFASPRKDADVPPDPGTPAVEPPEAKKVETQAEAKPEDEPSKPAAEPTPAEKAEQIQRDRKADEDRRILSEEADRLRQERARRDEAQPAAPPVDLQAIIAEMDAAKEKSVGSYETIKAAAEDYSEILELQFKIGQRQIKASAQAFEDRIAKLEAKLQESAIDAQHEEIVGKLESDEFGHADIRQLEGDPKFWEAVDKQTEAVKALLHSADPGDVALAVSAVKQSMGLIPAQARVEQPSRATALEQQRKAKERTDNLHRHTLRPHAAAPQPTGGADFSEEDAQSEFERAAKAAQGPRVG